MNNISKIVISVAAGAAVGATLGILFAPERGSELRKRIADRSRKIAQRGKKLAEEVKEKFEVKVNDRKETVNDLV
jgi:gas vesicle protein